MKFQMSEKGFAFLRAVNEIGDTAFKRYNKPGLEGGAAELIDEDELNKILALKGTDKDIEKRMPVKSTKWYTDLAKNSPALKNYVGPNSNETEDMFGSADPSNQESYMPTDGLLHKYEMGLIFVAQTCSAHCRLCYRFDLLGDAETGKSMASYDGISEYIITHNKKVEENGGIDPDTHEKIFMLREVLLSGGDPMVLKNMKLATWFAVLAESGINTIRVGTKELAFFPERFDDKFFGMIDEFHKTYPDVNLTFSVHFTHPDEFLQKDENGNYIEVDSKNGKYKWLDLTEKAVAKLAIRHDFISMENQTPIAKNTNDDPEALNLMQSELFKHGVENHYFFQGRDIVARRAFSVSVEETYRIVNESQKDLPGPDSHAKLVMSTEFGKIEVVGVTDPIKGGKGDLAEGFIVFKVLRSPHDASTRGGIVMAKLNPEADWIDGYLDRIIFDETGKFGSKDVVPEQKHQINYLVNQAKEIVSSADKQKAA